MDWRPTPARRRGSGDCAEVGAADSVSTARSRLCTYELTVGAVPLDTPTVNVPVAGCDFSSSHSLNVTNSVAPSAVADENPGAVASTLNAMMFGTPALPDASK